MIFEVKKTYELEINIAEISEVKEVAENLKVLEIFGLLNSLNENENENDKVKINFWNEDTQAKWDLKEGKSYKFYSLFYKGLTDSNLLEFVFNSSKGAKFTDLMVMKSYTKNEQPRNNQQKSVSTFSDKKLEQPTKKDSEFNLADIKSSFTVVMDNGNQITGFPGEIVRQDKIYYFLQNQNHLYLINKFHISYVRILSLRNLDKEKEKEKIKK